MPGSIKSLSLHYFLLPMNSIAAIIAEGNYTRVYFRGGERAEVLRPLSSWRKLLPERKFLQVHLKCLANRSAVTSATRARDGRLNLQLDCEIEEQVVIRRRSKEIADLLNL